MREHLGFRTARWAACAALLAVVLVTSPGPTDRGGPPYASTPHIEGGPAVFPVVEGRLQGANGVGISGAQVSAASYPCSTAPYAPSSIASCTIVATGITDADGAFVLTLPQVGGAYYLVANRTMTTGGTGLWFRASAEVTVLPTMTAPAYVPYGNASFVLPGYANLTQYFTAENLNVQVPILSWTADGVFYVNTALELVFYNLATGSVRPIAPWLPLYENVMNYAGVENTEWATTDGSFIYEFGCLSLCVNISRITFYGVNVTTGATYEWNYTGIVDDSTRFNVEAIVVGRDGASTDAVLILNSGVMLDWNFENGTQWTLGILPFFESNNIYWVSVLNAWFDVSADNSSSDEIEELEYTGSSIKLEAAGYWAANVASNFVGGMDYNLTDQRLYFTAGTCRTNRVVTAYASIGEGGIMDAVTSLGVSGCGFGHPLPQAPAGEPVGSSEHRIGMASSGPWVAGAWNSTFENGSWLLDPSDGAWSTSNVSQSWGVASANESYQQSYEEEGLFYNGSYLVGLPSASCAKHAPCPIDARTSRGTITWNWRLGEPEFPFPDSAPLAETSAPPTPALVNASINRTIVTLEWTENATPAQSILNETVYYDTTDPVGGPNGSVSLPGTARSVVLTELEPRSCYHLEVVALNLHWTSAPLVKSLCTGPTAPPGPPYWFNATSPSDSAILLAWQNPSGPLVNDTLYEGPDCAQMVAVSLGRPSDSYEITGLSGATVRCFRVQAWAATGPSNISQDLLTSSLPSPPVDLSVASAPDSSLELAWINPPGTIINDTVFFGPTCRTLAAEATDGPTGRWTLGGLAPAQRYCVAVEAWSLSGANATWAWANATTSPAAPTGLVAATDGVSSILVRWASGSPPSVDYAVAVGEACDDATVAWTGPANSTTIGGLQEDTTYCVSVSGIDEAGSGPSSPSVEVATLPDPPTGVQAISNEGGAYELVWTDPPGNLTNVTVFGGVQCVGQILAKLPGTAQALSLQGLVPTGRVCLGVAVEGPGGSSVVAWMNGTVGADVPAGRPSRGPPLAEIAILAIGAAAVVALGVGWMRRRPPRP
jgi:hypothetical protein